MSTTDSSGTTPEPGRSARQRLIHWANEQDGWIRAIAGEVLSTRREVSGEALSAVRDRYLAEKALADGDSSEVPVLGDGGSIGDVAETLKLTELRDCDGVNALASGQRIRFNACMTVLFGENAAGKTGYVGVLKLLADVVDQLSD